MAKIESRSDRFDITANKKTYHYERALTGRGQSGLAGFFKCNEQSFLIKQDKPETCLAESLAIIYEPPGMPFDDEPIIQAQVGIVDSKNNEPQKIVSIQSAFKPKSDGETIMPFDVLALGSKREPKTFVSEESKRVNKINETIGSMTPEVKKQLAQAIYTSQINGDESLHTGQFMVSVNGANQITKIQRIDFGALGRYALARNEFDPMKTSEQYTGKIGSQFKNDYVSFLMQDKDVKDHVLELWENTVVEDVMQLVEKRFVSQIGQINSPLLRKNALEGLHKTLSKNAKTVDKIAFRENFQDAVLKELITSTKNRCAELKAAAKIHRIENILAGFKEKSAEVNFSSKKIREIIHNPNKKPTARLLEVEKAIPLLDKTYKPDPGTILQKFLQKIMNVFLKNNTPAPVEKSKNSIDAFNDIKLRFKTVVDTNVSADLTDKPRPK